MQAVFHSPQIPGSHFRLPCLPARQNRRADKASRIQSPVLRHVETQDGRIESHARIVGNITDERILGLLKTAKGFRELVDSIGVVVEITEGDSEAIDFVLQMYGKGDFRPAAQNQQSVYPA